MHTSIHYIILIQTKRQKKIITQKPEADYVSNHWIL